MADILMFENCSISLKDEGVLKNGILERGLAFA